MDEGEQVSLSDLMKVKVEDAQGREIGHVQDMAIAGDLSRPYVDSLGVHLMWTDRVADVELVRSAEDVVVLVPWSVVSRAGEELFELSASHPALPAMSAAHKVLLRRDVMNKQMVDPDGKRIQRVDDVMLAWEAGRLKVVGLEVSKSMLLASSALRRYLAELRRKHAPKQDSEVIPWDAVRLIDSESVVLGQDVTH